MEFLFTKTRVAQLLAPLQADTKPLWGMMSAQHALEHLQLLFKIMDGRMPVTQIVPEDRVERAQSRLRDPEWALPVEFKAAFLPAEDLLPLEHPDLDSAKAQLLAEMDAMEQFFQDNPGIKTLHPYFGHLDHELWKNVHNKHFFHHFKQFGLIGEDEK